MSRQSLFSSFVFRAVRAVAITVASMAAQACSSDATAPAPVPVPVTVSAIVTAPGSLTLQGPGSTAAFQALITTSDGSAWTGAISWISDAPTVATVSGSGSAGNLTAVAVGTARITVSAGGQSASVAVTVLPAQRTLRVSVVGSGTVVSEPAGISCAAGICSAVFDEGTVVQLTATAGPNYRFDAWGGGCIGTSVCTMTLGADGDVTATFEERIQANGLTPQINALIPDSVMQRIVALGVPINRGGTPPSLEGTYLGAPLRLDASTVPGDRIGGQLLDILFSFTEQNNALLTLTAGYTSGPETADGLGSFIVGADSSFTVFSMLKVEVFGDTATAVMVFSGKRRAGGIADLVMANLLLDDRGNPKGYFIPLHTGRRFSDTDALSPHISTGRRVADGALVGNVAPGRGRARSAEYIGVLAR